MRTEVFETACSLLARVQEEKPTDSRILELVDMIDDLLISASEHDPELADIYDEIVRKVPEDWSSDDD